MVKKNNKKCILCGKTYTYCSRCEEFDIFQDGWRFIAAIIAEQSLTH